MGIAMIVSWDLFFSFHLLSMPTWKISTSNLCYLRWCIEKTKNTKWLTWHCKLNGPVWVWYFMCSLHSMQPRKAWWRRIKRRRKKLPVKGILHGHMWCDRIDFAYIFYIFYSSTSNSEKVAFCRFDPKKILFFAHTHTHMHSAGLFLPHGWDLSNQLGKMHFL